MSDQAYDAVGGLQVIRGESGAPASMDGAVTRDDGIAIKFVRESAPGAREVSSGFSTMPPMSFDSTFEQDETLLVLEGRAEVEVEGHGTTTLGAGDAIFLPKGMVTRWKVTKPWRDFFTLAP